MRRGSESGRSGQTGHCFGVYVAKFPSQMHLCLRRINRFLTPPPLTRPAGPPAAIHTLPSHNTPQTKPFDVVYEHNTLSCSSHTTNTPLPHHHHHITITSLTHYTPIFLTLHPLSPLRHSSNSPRLLLPSQCNHRSLFLHTHTLKSGQDV